MKNQNVVAREVAEAEFERFADSMDLDLDTSKMDEDDRKGAEARKATVVQAIERGRLVIDEMGRPVYTPKSDGFKALTFSEPTGAAYMAMDAKKADQSMARLYALMAAITGESAGLFSKLPARDLKVCQAIVTLFFA